MDNSLIVTSALLVGFLVVFCGALSTKKASDEAKCDYTWVSLIVYLVMMMFHLKQN